MSNLQSVTYLIINMGSVKAHVSGEGGRVMVRAQQRLSVRLVLDNKVQQSLTLRKHGRHTMTKVRGREEYLVASSRQDKGNLTSTMRQLFCEIHNVINKRLLPTCGLQ